MANPVITKGGSVNHLSQTEGLLFFSTMNKSPKVEMFHLFLFPRKIG